MDLVCENPEATIVAIYGVNEEAGRGFRSSKVSPLASTSTVAIVTLLHHSICGRASSNTFQIQSSTLLHTLLLLEHHLQPSLPHRHARLSFSSHSPLHRHLPGNWSIHLKLGRVERLPSQQRHRSVEARYHSGSCDSV
jgi:hypothetical protein